MPSLVGRKIGAYEILSHIGSGGMGDVYRARDTRLKRNVAIKVLPEGFAQDPDRLARFQREAEVLATLSHSNIAAVYGLEKDSGITGIIQELVEGESLAEIIARGPSAVADALPIARQIAEALEAAHDKSIVHRDLKPANIKLTADGTVKVLDFGLAKMLETESVSSSLSASPTLSAHPTYAGVILGTAPYMSPEQARGKQVDRRTDIWSFGCVLFEMLTGKLAFEGGETVSDAIASVLKGEPDWNALPTDTPPHIRTLLRRCLQKDVKKRLPHIGIARIEIDEGPAEAPPDAGAVNVIPTPVSKWHRTVPWAVTALALLGMITVFFLRPNPTPQPAAPVWVSAELGADVSLFTNQGAAPGDSLALSRDGTMLAFVGLKGTTRQLYVRRLGQLKAVALAGTEGARNPFFSPDGNWVAFFADRALKKVSITGGATISLSDVGLNNDRGGTWSEDDAIIYSAGPNTGLARVSSAGGKPEQLTKPNPLDPTQRWPQSLPNSKGVLYTVRPSPAANFDDAHIVIQPSSASPPKVVLRGGYFGRYLASGHLVYIHTGTLFAAPFDLNKLEVIGPSVPVIEGVASNNGTAGANFTVSDNGTLVFLPGEGASNDAPIQWLQGDGKISELRSLASDWSNPHFSPDGRRLAVDLTNPQGADIWVYDWARDTFMRLTFDPANETKPVWTPDGQRIVFASTRGNGSTSNLYWQRSDGTGEIQRLTNSPNQQLPGSWHPSGKFLAFQEQTGGGFDLIILPMEGNEASGWKPGKPIPLLSTPATETEPMFSPDGRWIAYSSQESGALDVYVRPFPGPGGKWQISSGGGQFPTWSRTRNEMFYRSLDNRIMEVTYTVEGNSFKAEKPKTWSERTLLPRPRGRMFDLHPDGNRFAVALADAGAQATADKIVFVFNFFEELRRIAPVRTVANVTAQFPAHFKNRSSPATSHPEE